MNEVEIRKLHSIEDFDQVVKLQKIVWGLSDIDLTPAHHFDISVKTGAILLGAFVEKELAGYVYSFPACYKNRWVQHSRQLGVLLRFRGGKIGKMLKWAQRRDALEKGYQLITWTVEPLLSRNARLNFHTLGAVTRTYMTDFYRATPALSLASGVPVDRLYLEWHLSSRRVEERFVQSPGPPGLEIASVLQRMEGSSPGLPGVPDLFHSDKELSVEIPRDIGRFSENRSFISAWQEAVRVTLDHYFAGGYRIDDFILAEDRCFYILRLLSEGELDED